jgi:hypothetical protein
MRYLEKPHAPVLFATWIPSVAQCSCNLNPTFTHSCLWYSYEHREGQDSGDESASGHFPFRSLPLCNTLLQPLKSSALCPPLQVASLLQMKLVHTCCSLRHPDLLGVMFEAFSELVSPFLSLNARAVFLNLTLLPLHVPRTVPRGSAA